MDKKEVGIEFNSFREKIIYFKPTIYYYLIIYLVLLALLVLYSNLFLVFLGSFALILNLLIQFILFYFFTKLKINFTKDEIIILNHLILYYFNPANTKLGLYFILSYSNINFFYFKNNQLILDYGIFSNVYVSDVPGEKMQEIREILLSKGIKEKLE